MLAESVPRSLSRYRVPPWARADPSTEAHWGPLRAGPKQAPCYERRCLFTTTLGAAEPRP
eukprot:731638-Alexandrium_andersonii.AAC.1